MTFLDLHFLVVFAVLALLRRRLADERGRHGLAVVPGREGRLEDLAVAAEDPARAVRIGQHHATALHHAVAAAAARLPADRLGRIIGQSPICAHAEYQRQHQPKGRYFRPVHRSSPVRVFARTKGLRPTRPLLHNFPRTAYQHGNPIARPACGQIFFAELLKNPCSTCLMARNARQSALLAVGWDQIRGTCAAGRRAHCPPKCAFQPIMVGRRSLALLVPPYDKASRPGRNGVN